jgi:hypothetical protein
MDDVEEIEASVASVKLQETEENASQQGKDEVVIRVNGTKFFLERATIDLLQSEFLDKMIDPETNFKKPEDGVYSVEANEECFSAFLHMIRYGSLPACMILDKEKESAHLQEAFFWGIEGKVREKIRETKTKLKISRRDLDNATRISIAVEKSKAHHNFREDDGCARIYCTECCNRDIDSRYSNGDKYTRCFCCDKMVYYKRDLGWCHKCSLCTDCQRSNSECPANRQVSSSHGGMSSTTAELEKKLLECITSITFQD